MSDLLWLDEIGPGNAARVGGKAYNCARMRQVGLPVPDGIAISAQATQNETVLAELRQRLVRWPADTLFAVRSSALDEDSAQHSFAGMHVTRLKVAADDVAEAVRACWASVTSERAQAYREAQGVTTNFATAVLVQVLVPAISSGVVFTRNPVSGTDEIVINAASGLGEALVSGMVDPYEWHLQKRDSALLSSRSGAAAQPPMTDTQVRELGELALRIERFFGSAQDIEWCHDGRQFWIVQARPITTLSRRLGIEWSRANVREVLPDLPPPQIVDFVCYMINEGERLYAGRLWAPEAELGPLMKAFNGRPYFNITQFRHICPILGMAPAKLLKSLGYTELRPEDELVPPRRWDLFFRALPDILRTVWYQLRLRPLIHKHLRDVQRDIDFTTRSLAAGLDARTMWAYMKARRKDAPRQLFPVFALSGVMNLEDQLRNVLQRVPFSYDDLVAPVVAAGQKSVTSQQAFDLLRVAAIARSDPRVRDYFGETASYENYRDALAGTEFLKRFDDFLAKYGHRGHYESDWSRPHYAEDPTPLLAAIAAHVQAPACPSADEIISRQEHDAAEAWKHFDQVLNRRQRLFVAPTVRFLLRRIKQMYLWRELYRSELTRLSFAMRKWHLVLSEQFVATGWLQRQEDYFLLTYDELGAVVEGQLSKTDVENLVARRRADMEAWAALDMPLSLRESELPRIRPRPSATVEHAAIRELKGLCVSRGVAEAAVVVLQSPADFARMKRGAIIVAPATDPSWTPLFTLASGLIVEIGGTLSHAAIVAREYGLPALANVRNATQLLKDGDRVRLDASGGRAEVLESRAHGMKGC